MKQSKGARWGAEEEIEWGTEVAVSSLEQQSALNPTRWWLVSILHHNAQSSQYFQHTEALNIGFEGSQGMQPAGCMKPKDAFMWYNVWYITYHMDTSYMRLH